jgi:hypothetical protein
VYFVLLIEKTEFDEILILGVQSQILHDYLHRFERPNDKRKFHYRGGDFIWRKLHKRIFTIQTCDTCFQVESSFLLVEVE